MSAPVDVLAVLSDAERCVELAAQGHRLDIGVPARLREVRAAVAELIEAARNHLEAYGARYDASERIGADADLRASLARFGGAA